MNENIDTAETLMNNVNEESTVQAIEPTVEQIKTKPVYKKTDRTRTVDKHKLLDIAIEDLQENLKILLGQAVDVAIGRSDQRRYARALFRVEIGHRVLDGKTMEEFMEFANGIKLAADLKGME